MVSTSDFGSEGSSSSLDRATKISNMKRNLNIRTKLATLLSKCARRIDPQGYQHCPILNAPEPIQFTVHTKSIERIMAQVKYSREYLEEAPEQLERDCIFPEIAEKIANKLLECGYIKIERIDTPREHQWIAKLHVVEI